VLTRFVIELRSSVRTAALAGMIRYDRWDPSRAALTGFACSANQRGKTCRIFSRHLVDDEHFEITR